MKNIKKEVKKEFFRLFKKYCAGYETDFERIQIGDYLITMDDPYRVSYAALYIIFKNKIIVYVRLCGLRSFMVGESGNLWYDFNSLRRLAKAFKQANF